MRTFFSAIFVLCSLVALCELSFRVGRIRERANLPPEALALSQSPWQTESPLTGYAVRPLYRGSSTGEFGPVKWKTNSWGMRGPEPVLPRPAGQYRILCLGDASLLGADLPDDAVLARQLSQRLSSRSQAPVEVWSGVIPEATPLTLDLAYRRVYSPLQPQLLILHLSRSNLERLEQQRRWITRNAHGGILACANPALTGSPSSNLWRECRQEFATLDWLLNRLGQWDTSSATNEGRPQHSSPEVTAIPLKESELSTVLAAIAELQTFCRANSTQLVVCFAPDRRHPETLHQHQQFTQAAMPWLQARQIPAIDAISWMSPDMVEEAGGWTASGHQRLAEFLASQLLTNLPGPWSGPAGNSTGRSGPAILPINHAEATPRLPQMPAIQRAHRQ